MMTPPSMGPATTEAFPLLYKTLPQYAARLAALMDRFPGHVGGVEPVNPGLPEEKPKDRPTTPTSAARRAKEKFVAGQMATQEPAHEIGSKKLFQKPGQNKARFSALSGPEVMYDGASQACFFEVWTQLNSTRGQLRKEMMLYKRKRVLMPANLGYDSEDDLSAESEEEEEEDPETRQRRMEEEKRKREEEKAKAEMERKMSETLEYIDSRLDRASKACENAAFLWLKGEGCPGHILFINHRLYEAVERIQTVYVPPPPAPAVVDEDGYASADEDGEDEGLGCVDHVDAHDSETELPHKEPAHRRAPKMPDPPHANHAVDSVMN